MTAKDAIRETINMCREVTLAYVQDLSDADLLLRSVPGANHIAWQLGHLIVSEHDMLTTLGYDMPPLPAGFADAYHPDAAKSDAPARFHSKAEYLALMKQVREAALAALAATPANVLEQPGPESMRAYAPTVWAVFMVLGTHELMHAGQFVPVRRKLGKPPLF